MKDKDKCLFPGMSGFIAVLAALLISIGVTGCSTKSSTGLITNSSGGNYRSGSIGEFEKEVGKVVRFTTDSTKLTDESRRILAGQARWLNRYSQYSIILEGHADERGTREYNIGLGAQRADTVRRYLASRGVNPSRIRTISYGKERPVALCDNISCWSQNRRVVTILNSRAGS